MTDLAINLIRKINAPVERVFDAWLDASTLSQFIMPMPEMPKPRTEVDASVGGKFAVFMVVGDQEVPHRGTYLEIDRPNRLVFTWESPFSCEGSVVTISLNSINNQETEIVFSHVKFIDEETRSNHEAGWIEILNKLDTVTKIAVAA